MRFFALSLLVTTSSAFAGHYGDKLSALMTASQATVQANGLTVLEGHLDGSSTPCAAVFEQQGQRSTMELRVQASRDWRGHLVDERNVEFLLVETSGLENGEADSRIAEAQESSSHLRLKTDYDEGSESPFPGGFRAVTSLVGTLDVNFDSRTNVISKMKVTRQTMSRESATCRFDN